MVSSADRLVVLSVIAVCALFGARVCAAQVNMDDVLAVWMFDEDKGDTVEDASGNDHTGVVNGDPEWVEGKFNSALSFDGDGDWLEADVIAIETVDFSMGCWVNPGEQENQWANLMSSHNNDGDGFHGISFEQNAAVVNHMYFIAGSNNGWHGQGGFTQLEEDTWQHFAVVRTGDNLVHYYNGEVGAEVRVQEEPFDPATNPFRIAQWARGPNENRAFNAIVDEAFLFSRALDPDEIQTLATVGFSRIRAVEPAGKLAAAWGAIKSAAR